MDKETVTLDFLAKQAVVQAKELHRLRSDVADMMKLLTVTHKALRQVEQRQRWRAPDC